MQKSTRLHAHMGLGPANSSSQDRIGWLAVKLTAPSGGWPRDWRGWHRKRQPRMAPKEKTPAAGSYLESRTSQVMR